ncbi:MAG: hypothetical protein IKD10_00610 [Lentisphaeria bacterium]|nr:hypothetical protein [Lentisphaeria bacterium]MBR7143415.1 hypothetical protein [Lentisphaeria bacterium]
MKSNIFLAGLLTMGFCVCSASAAPAVIEHKVPANNTGTAYTRATFPPMQLEEGERAVLTFKARIQNPTVGGWTRAMQMRMNGKIFTNAHALVRKEISMAMGKDKKIEKEPLFDAKNNVLLYYAPDFEQSVDKRIVTDRELGMQFKIDVSDMISSERENFLTIHNTRYLYSMRKIFKNIKDYQFVIVVSDIKLVKEKISDK